MKADMNLYAVEGVISLRIDENNKTVIVRNKYCVIIAAKNEDDATNEAFDQFKNNSEQGTSKEMNIKLKVQYVQDITPRLVVVKEPVNA